MTDDLSYRPRPLYNVEDQVLSSWDIFLLMSGLTMGETNLRVIQDSVPYSTP